MKTAEEWDDQFDKENRHGEGAYNLGYDDIRAIQLDALQEAARVCCKWCAEGNPAKEVNCTHPTRQGNTFWIHRVNRIERHCEGGLILALANNLTNGGNKL